MKQKSTDGGDGGKVSTLREGTEENQQGTKGKGTWRWWVSVVALQVISMLPAVWGVWSVVVLVVLFPLTGRLLYDLAFTVVILLVFIASAVRRDPDDPAKKVVWAGLGVLTAYHVATGALWPLLSPASLFYFLWLYTALVPFFDASQGRYMRTWPAFLRLPLWQWMEEDYFPITVTRMKELDPTKQYLFTYAPHGLWTWGLWTALISKQFRELFPNISWRILVATPLLMLPGAGHFIHWIGGISATAEAAAETFKAGHSVVVIPGGLAEAILSSPTEPAILLKGRRGFVKLAIKNGTPIVPMYGFGETSLFRQISFMREQRLRWSRLLGFPITIFCGFLGTPAPESKPVHVIVGSPVDVKQNDKPTEEDIDEVFARYEARLLELYEAYKPPNDPPLPLNLLTDWLFKDMVGRGQR